MQIILISNNTLDHEKHPSRHESREELKQIARHFAGVPLFANIIEGGKTPNLSVQELGEMGYKLVAFALSGLFSVSSALRECFESLKQDGSTANVNKNLSFEEFKNVIGMEKHLALEKKFGIQS